jgi:SAM-dependent methyltransferase
MMAQCRSCGASLTHSFVDLGHTPLANSYLPDRHALAQEKSYPLHVKVCSACFLVQLSENVSEKAIFSHDYAYLSSCSASWVAHAERYTGAMITRFDLTPDSLVMEVASNDGYLLQHFVAEHIPVLGIEPAGHAASLAEAKGVPTKVAFFTQKLGQELAAAGQQADLIAANNVLAHVPDIQDFMAGFSFLLKRNGVLTFEFPHLLNLIDKVQFDTIYHEHYSYLSLLVVKGLCEQHGLRVFDVEQLPTHGGSLRVYVCREEARHEEAPSVRACLEEEKAAHLDDLEGYKGFAARVDTIVQNAREFIRRARQEGKTVAAFGAAAKGNTFLNVAGLTHNDIAFAVDSNPLKQNTLLPGSHIPVFAPDKIAEKKPDYIIILPWNLSEEITGHLQFAAEWGAQCVTFIPQLKIYR